MPSERGKVNPKFFNHIFKKFLNYNSEGWIVRFPIHFWQLNCRLNGVQFTWISNSIKKNQNEQKTLFYFLYDISRTVSGRAKLRLKWPSLVRPNPCAPFPREKIDFRVKRCVSVDSNAKNLVVNVNCQCQLSVNSIASSLNAKNSKDIIFQAHLPCLGIIFCRLENYR